MLCLRQRAKSAILKKIKETETEVSLTFGKSEAEINAEETTGWHKDKKKYREARPA